MVLAFLTFEVFLSIHTCHDLNRIEKTAIERLNLMPAFLGAVQILNVAGTAVVQFGDLAFLSPKSATKESIGGNGGNTGAFNVSNQLLSINNTLDTSVVEQPIAANN